MKKVGQFILVVVGVVIVHHFSLIVYGIGQATGQLNIIWNAEPIEEFIKKESVSDSIKAKLQFIEEVRKYAVDSLGLNESDNYTTIYDQKGQPVLWVVTGCKPFAFEPMEWKFPVLGSVPYKGFFDPEKATAEMQKVRDQGYDAGIRTVGGWSTLGWFNDPILSNMLNRSYGDLANLIIHELVHATVFVRDSIEFNENLASFIADKGAVEFMKQKFGNDSQELNRYLDDQYDESIYITHILNGVDTLENLYNSFGELSIENKIKQKNKLIEAVMLSSDTLSLRNADYLTFLKGQIPNNTYFMSFLRYRSKQQALDSIYMDRFDRQIQPFVDDMKTRYPYL